MKPSSSSIAGVRDRKSGSLLILAAATLALGLDSWVVGGGGAQNESSRPAANFELYSSLLTASGRMSSDMSRIEVVSSIREAVINRSSLPRGS